MLHGGTDPHRREQFTGEIIAAAALMIGPQKGTEQHGKRYYYKD